MNQQGFEALIEEYGGRQRCIDMLKYQNKLTQLFVSNLTEVIYSGERGIISQLEDSSEYRDLLLEAISSNDYAIIDNYFSSILATQLKNNGPSLAAAFESTYIPGPEGALYGFLRKCDEEFQDTGKSYYGKFCSVVQSSGTGKSRTLIELRRQGAIVLYINIRGKNEGNSYPPRDEIPSQLLTEELDGSAEDYASRCVAFFTALFKTLKAFLISYSTSGRSREEIIEIWSSNICTIGGKERADFFVRLREEFRQTATQIGYILPERPNTSIPTSSTQGNIQEPLAPQMEALSTSNESWGDGNQPNIKENGPQLHGEVMMTNAYNDLLSLDPQVILTNTCDPQLVIVIDEAHTLRQLHNSYLPSHLFCRVISAFSTSERPLSSWVVFASTTSNVADLSAPAHIYPSLRISQGGRLLFPPYSALGWDQKVLPFSSVMPEDVARFTNIVRLGRPLWQSLVESGVTPDKILATAGTKLCHGEDFDVNNPNQLLAVFGQRFILDICFKRYRPNTLVQEGIASHLRFCFETSADHILQRSGYPSEPLLSCVSAQLTYDGLANQKRKNNLEVALAHLQTSVVDQIIEAGQKGELVSRLVYLIAKDLLIRRNSIEIGLDPNLELPDCRPLPVVDYLAFLFGDANLTSKAKELLDGWHINFSHWITMTEPITFPGSSVAQLSTMERWLMHHWMRTCAIQCCHRQPSFDKLIPMYKLRASSPPTTNQDGYAGRVSFILISDKCQTKSSRYTLDQINPKRAGLPAMNRPYVSILADLGLEESSLELSFEANQHNLRIYAPGMRPNTYQFLNEAPHIIRHLQGMLHPPKISDQNISANVKAMMDRAEFGTTTEVEHWKWGSGRT